MNTFATVLRRAFAPAPLATVVPLRSGAGHAPTPAPATGVGNHRTPTDRLGALTVIASALTRDGWGENEARRIMQVADEGMGELVATAASAVLAARLERAMPGGGR